MGRPAKSEAEHALNGTRSHAGSQQSRVPAGRPKFPKDVPQEAKRVFKRLCITLEERRQLTKGDYELLRLYCLAWDRHQRQQVLLREEGEVCKYIRLDSNGQPHDQWKKNLRFDIVIKCEQQMTALLDRLGLTPIGKDRAKPVAAPELKPELIPGTCAHYLATYETPAPVVISPEEMVEEETENGIR